MSYIPYIFTFLLVLSPLFIPVGVTVVHAILTWRSRSTGWRPPPHCNVGAQNSPSNCLDRLQN